MLLFFFPDKLLIGLDCLMMPDDGAASLLAFLMDLLDENHWIRLKKLQEYPKSSSEITVIIRFLQYIAAIAWSRFFMMVNASSPF